MRTKFSSSIIACLFLAVFSNVGAQTPRQAILVNGNLFMAGNHATIASYNLSTNAYQVFDSIPARFASDIVIDNNAAFVAADSLVLRFNIDTYQQEAVAVLPGVRRLALWGNVLLATTGYGGTTDHVHALSTTDLQTLFSVSGISGDCEGIAVHNDSAYVAVPGAFGAPSGSLAIIDLSNQILAAELDLDSNGRGIEKVYVSGGKLWTINPIAFGNPWGVVTEFEPANRSHVHHRVEFNTLHSPGLSGSHLYLRRGADGVFQFDPSTGTVTDSMVVQGNFAGGAVDTLNQEYLMTETDYFSYGKLWRFNAQGNVLDSVNVGISPESIAIDYRGATAVVDASPAAGLAMWPVPAQSVLHLRLSARAREVRVEIIDIQGRVRANTTHRKTELIDLDVAALPSGCYVIRVSGSGLNLQGRFLK